MKTPKARNNSGDDWKTPDWFYNQLDKIYHFDFDPCPYQTDFDGLKISWGKTQLYKSTLFKKIKGSLCKESCKGKLCVLLLPVSTSTKLFHVVILPNAKKIEFVRGRLKFEQKEENGNFVSRGTGQHDSMIVVFS